MKNLTIGMVWLLAGSLLLAQPAEAKSFGKKNSAQPSQGNGGNFGASSAAAPQEAVPAAMEAVSETVPQAVAEDASAAAEAAVEGAAEGLPQAEMPLVEDAVITTTDLSAPESLLAQPMGEAPAIEATAPAVPLLPEPAVEEATAPMPAVEQAPAVQAVAPTATGKSPKSKKAAPDVVSATAQPAAPAAPLQISGSGGSIPTDLQSCLAALEQHLTKQQAEEFKARSATQLADEVVLADWVRQIWITPSGSPLREFFNQKGVFNPEQITALILKTFHQYLNKQPVDLDAEIEKFRAVASSAQKTLPTGSKE